MDDGTLARPPSAKDSQHVLQDCQTFIMEMTAIGSQVKGDAQKWTLTGTRSTEEKVNVRGCDLFEFRNGKISKKDWFWKIIQR